MRRSINDSPKTAAGGVGKSATAFRDVQPALFNRSVHKPVHKGDAYAIHAVFIGSCTPCTTFVAWRMEIPHGTKCGVVVRGDASGRVIGVDRDIVTGKVAGPEAAGAVAESKIDVD